MFNPKLFSMGFVLGKLLLRQGFLLALGSHLISYISPFLRKDLLLWSYIATRIKLVECCNSGIEEMW